MSAATSTRHLRFGIAGIFTVFAIFLSLTSPRAATNDATHPVEPRLIAVFFHAEWCPPCKVLRPRWTSLKTHFHKQEVLFWEIDVTDDKTLHTSISGFPRPEFVPLIREEAVRSGLFLLIEPGGNPVTTHILTTHQDTDEMVQRINTLLFR